MELENIRNIVIIGTGALTAIALFITIRTFVKHKERYVQQKAYEWAINKVMEHLEYIEKSWRQSTKVHNYVCILAVKSKHNISWSIVEEEKTCPSQMKEYRELHEQLLNSFYFFNNEMNPLVNQVLTKEEMKKCFNILDKYKPFSINTFVQLEQKDEFINLSNDLLVIQSTINNALAKKII